MLPFFAFLMWMNDKGIFRHLKVFFSFKLLLTTYNSLIISRPAKVSAVKIGPIGFPIIFLQS